MRVVAARRTGEEYRRSILLAALDRAADAAAESARRTLSRRWSQVEAVVLDKAPVEAILDEAARFAASVIVLGWRGHGAVRRFLMGSVSRGIVRNAKCAVLVVRRSLRVRRIVVGLDGSPTAKRALAFVAGLVPPTDGRVILVTAVIMMPAPSRALVPGAAAVASEVKRTNARREKAAMRELNRAAARLARAGWQTRTVRTRGEPLRDLLGTVASGRAHLLVVGARGTSGLDRLLLGSVAEGALDRSLVPVLIAR
jgi:nucleotide-binding universal stress UspA family protein